MSGPPKGLAEQNRRSKGSAKNRLHIITMNCKYGLKDAPTKDLLINQVSKIKYDIIGLCETRAKAESRTKWIQSGDELIIGEGSGQQRIGGIGFIINPESPTASLKSKSIRIEWQHSSST